VDDSRKLIKLAVPSQGVEAYQAGFEPAVHSSEPLHSDRQSEK